MPDELLSGSSGLREKTALLACATVSDGCVAGGAVSFVIDAALRAVCAVASALVSHGAVVEGLVRRVNEKSRLLAGFSLQLVPRRGLEPPRLAALVPETSASTNSAIWAGMAHNSKAFSGRKAFLRFVDQFDG